MKVIKFRNTFSALRGFQSCFTEAAADSEGLGVGFAEFPADRVVKDHLECLGVAVGGVRQFSPELRQHFALTITVGGDVVEFVGLEDFAVLGFYGEREELPAALEQALMEEDDASEGISLDILALAHEGVHWDTIRARDEADSRC